MKRTIAATLAALTLTAATCHAAESPPALRSVHGHCLNALPITQSNGDLTDAHPFNDYLHDWDCSPRPE